MKVGNVADICKVKFGYSGYRQKMGVFVRRMNSLEISFFA